MVSNEKKINREKHIRMMYNITTSILRANSKFQQRKNAISFATTCLVGPTVERGWSQLLVPSFAMSYSLAVFSSPLLCSAPKPPPECLGQLQPITWSFATPNCSQGLCNHCPGALGGAERLVQDKPCIQREEVLPVLHMHKSILKLTHPLALGTL